MAGEFMGRLGGLQPDRVRRQMTCQDALRLPGEAAAFRRVRRVRLAVPPPSRFKFNALSRRRFKFRASGWSTLKAAFKLEIPLRSPRTRVKPPHPDPRDRLGVTVTSESEDLFPRLSPGRADH